MKSAAVPRVRNDSVERSEVAGDDETDSCWSSSPGGPRGEGVEEDISNEADMRTTLSFTSSAFPLAAKTVYKEILFWAAFSGGQPSRASLQPVPPFEPSSRAA